MWSKITKILSNIAANAMVAVLYLWAFLSISLNVLGILTFPDTVTAASNNLVKILDWLLGIPPIFPLVAAVGCTILLSWLSHRGNGPLPALPKATPQVILDQRKDAVLTFEFDSSGFDLDSQFRHSVEQRLGSAGLSEVINFEDLIIRVKSSARLDNATTRLQINSDDHGNEITLEPVGAFSGVVGPGQACSILISRRSLEDGTIVLLPDERRQARPKIGSIYEVKLQVFHSAGTEEAQFRVNFRSARKHPHSTVYKAENIQLPAPKVAGPHEMFLGFHQPKLTFSDTETAATGNVIAMPFVSSTSKET